MGGGERPGGVCGARCNALLGGQRERHHLAANACATSPEFTSFYGLRRPASVFFDAGHIVLAILLVLLCLLAREGERGAGMAMELKSVHRPRHSACGLLLVIR